MEVIKDSAPVDKRKLDPNKVGKVLLKVLSCFVTEKKGREGDPLETFMLKH